MNAFFDKLEAFCLKDASLFDNNSNLHLKEENQWNILSETKITEFITQIKRQIEDHSKTTSRYSKCSQISPLQSPQILKSSTNVQVKSSIKESLTYNPHLFEEQEKAIPRDPLDISILSEFFQYTQRLISCSPRHGSASLNDHMETLVSSLCLEWSHPGAFHAESIMTFGRLCSDVVDNAKWNEKSILLETSRSLASGHRVKCHTDNLSTFSFFPGQVVTVEGKVSSKGFIIDRLIPLPQLKKAVSSLSESISNQRLINILVECGPYGNTRILDACLCQVTDQTNLLILLGPFIDEDMEKTLTTFSDESFDDLFSKHFLSRFQTLLQKFQQLTIVLVPSTRDTFHYDVSLPQEPFNKAINNIIHNRLILMPNPAIFAINQVIIALTSSDILFDLSAYEISRQGSSATDGLTMDRMSRLCKHLLDQRHFYPLYPSNPSTPIKNGFCLDGMSIPVSPDILILPSQHRCFVKNVEGVLCINPGKTCRSLNGGTIAKLVIHPMKLSNTRESDQILASHLIESRCRVDILSINQ